jgi:HAE1 family hydrophobic/amphiphilic exporter-1
MLAVGMLIDNAVVVLESIYRRMGLGEGAVEATLNGTRDVGRAVTSATLTTIIVFAPIVFGARSEIVVWLKEVGITISVTLVFSLLVSLTLIPVLTSHILKGGRQSVARNPVVERAGGRYEKVLRWTAVRHPWITGVPIALGVLALTVGAVVATDFKPDALGERGIRQEYLQFMYEFSDNVNYRVAKEYVQEVQEVLWPLREKYGVKNMYSWYQDNNAATRLYFQKTALSEKELKTLRTQIREELPTLAGVKFVMGGDEDEGGPKRFSVTIHGEDSEELGVMANEVKRRLELVPDVQDVTTDIERGAEEIQVRVDPDKARRFGLNPAQVAEIMGITFRGVRLPNISTGEREVELWVSLEPEDRTNIENLKSLTVAMIEDREITLDQVATTVIGRGPERIQRLNQRTAVRVRGNYEGEDFDDVLDEVRAVMKGVHFPPGYGWNFGSEIQEAQEQQNEMLINVLLAMICVYMVMASLFESLTHPAVVMFCLPFASLGVIWLMIVTNTPFNLMAMIGMVILIGVVVNNGIVLVDHINHHRKAGLSLEEALVRGGRERFRPILMTAATTVLGLIPLAVGSGHVGDAELYPMARALMGGLLSSTVLTLIMLPVYYHLNEKMIVLLRRLPRGILHLPGRIGRGVRRLRGRPRGVAIPGSAGGGR